MSRNKNKDWDLGTLLSVVGFVFELIRVIVNALRKRDGTIDHLRRFLKEPDLVDKVFDLIVEKTVEVFTAFVKYVQPTYAQLRSTFGWVSNYYEKAEFEAVESCRDVIRQNGELQFEYVHLNRYASTDEVFAVMDRQGLRPALYEEGLGFAERNPDEQRKFSIVILGSTCVGSHGSSSVAFLDSFEGKRRLDLWVDGDWPAHSRFLAVRK
jgi:hypothetical protein